GRAHVELRAVNRKQAEVAITLPEELSALEDRIRTSVASCVVRGRCDVRIQWDGASPLSSARINRTNALAYAKEFAALASELGLPATVSLELIARCPGVMQSDSTKVDVAPIWPVVETALVQALAEFIRSREREGDHLRGD